MNYSELIKKSFQVTLRYKFLWWLGILASLTSGGGFNFNFQFGSSDFSSLFQKKAPSQDMTSFLDFQPFGRVLGESTKNQCCNYSSWISQNLDLFILLLAIGFLLILIIMAISLMAKGGLVSSVVSIEKEEQSSFKMGMRAGYQKFWSIFGAEIIIGLFVIFSIIILGTPIALLIIYLYYWAALGLGIFLLVILIPILIYLSVISMYSIRFIIHQSQGAISSINSAHRLIMQKKQETLFVWLISLGIGFAISFIITIAFFLLIMPLIILGIGIYFGLGVSVLINYIILVGFLIFLGLLFFSGIMQTYISTYWTLAYLELIKNDTLNVTDTY